MAFSTPLICCSSGVMTVSAMVFGEAPGYWPLTTTVGGTISGYSLMGSDGYGQQAGHGDQDGEHGREDRPLDEERGNVHGRHFPFAGAGGCCWSAAATVASPRMVTCLR